METGNPKQVAVLCVMAVGALGFLATRLGGRDASSLASAVPQQSEKTGAASIPINLPLLIDAFSHPKLAAPKPKVEPSETTTIRPAMVGTVGGPLPLVGDIETDRFVRPIAEPVEEEEPKEEAPLPPPPPSPIEVAVEGTAGASDNVAFLSVEGAESRSFQPGDQIKGKVRLLRIEDGAIVLSGPKGELTINVGERKRI